MKKIGYLLNLGILLLVLWKSYDFYVSGKTNMAITLLVTYVVVLIIVLINNLHRRRLRKEFNEIFPE